MLTSLELARWQIVQRLFPAALELPPVELLPELPPVELLPELPPPAEEPLWQLDLTRPVGLFLAGLAWQGGAAAPPLSLPTTVPATARELLASLPWSGGSQAPDHSQLPALLALATSTAMGAARRQAVGTESARAWFHSLPWNLPIGA